MKRIIIFSLILILSFSVFTGCENEAQIINGVNVIVHFIDVGQGDSELIILPDKKIVLIDAGIQKEGINVIKYLKRYKIKRIDYLVATHPHEDHIGGLPDIIRTFEIGNIYMPKVSHNTATYLEFLNGIKNKGLKINTARSGVNLLSENDLSIDFIAPNENNYKEINDYSAVLMLRYKSIKMLFTGDIQSESEKQVINKHEIKADLLKVAHHGSSTSTSKLFLRAVTPKYAVISVGEGNEYNHPSQRVLENLNSTVTYRTDLNGTIIAVSDGNNIIIKPEKEVLK